MQWGEAQLTFLPAVRGLVSEGGRVRRAIEEAEPQAVGVTVGREDLAGLQEYDGTEQSPGNWEEELYVAGLARWGEVRKPPPCYLEAVRAAVDRDLALRALDFNDEDYTDRYVTYVTTWDLILHSRLEKKARKHAFVAETPEAFVLEFDRLVNDPEGYVELEKAREKHIAKRIAKRVEKDGSLLAVVEYERAGAVRKILDDYRPRN